MIAQMTNLVDSPELMQLAAEWPLACTFRLEPMDTVVVAGAYEGRVIDLLTRLYPGIVVHGFDPQVWAIDRCTERVGDNPNVHLYGFAIGTKSGPLPMVEWNTDACSFMAIDRPNPRIRGEGHMREFGQAMDFAGVSHINLAVFNMEGYEFALLPHLFDHQWLDRIDRLAIQWHPGVYTAGDWQPVVSARLQECRAVGHQLIVDTRPQWTYSERRTR